MMQADAIGAIKSILGVLKRNPALAQTLSDDANIVEDVGLDSLQMLQFMLDVEERLGVRIDFEVMEFSDLHSITRFTDFLAGMPRQPLA